MKIAISTNKYLDILNQIKNYLKTSQKNYKIIDINEGKKLDIFSAAFKVAHLVNNKKADYGIIIDEFGNGGFIIASKFKNTIVAELSDEHSAHMTKEHNNTNIITLGGKLTAIHTMFSLIDRYLNSNFSAGRHLVRTEMLDELLKQEKGEK